MTRQDWRSKVDWKQAGYRAYFTRIKNENMFTEEEAHNYLQERECYKYEEEQAKKFRKLILSSGVKDVAYDPEIPVWVKNKKKGIGLDEWVGWLKDYGFMVENAQDVMNLIEKYCGRV